MNARSDECAYLEEPVVSLSPCWSSRVQVAVKRVLEFTISFAALFVLSPFCVLLAIAIKLSSPGPVFYRCNWVGQHGRPFVGYKFRSMVMDADHKKFDLLTRNEMTGPVFKITDDPRVTRLGSWMRRHSLDEIPQLFSVLKGDMSLVGPRPPLRTEYEHYAAWEKQKLLVKPGITCLWQVSGRNTICDFHEWVRLDFEYISNWSLALDAVILLKTVREVLAGSGK
ncbi:MAG: sugar transferase [Terracidiphilus sp.]|jgi:lipopolysaccharide/colanic/teichoic acid biosynthesis glycosyltransferase